MQVTKTLYINVLGVLNVTVSAPSKTYTGTQITVTVRLSGDVYGHWEVDVNWGDGATEHHTFYDELPPWSLTHTYSKTGTFKITVSVDDMGSGASGTGTATVTVAAPVSVSFTASNTNPRVNEQVTFTADISGGFPPYTWRIDYGDGTSENGTLSSPGRVTRSKAYSRAGTYKVVLTVTDSLGTAMTAGLEIGAAVPGVPAEIDWRLVGGVAAALAVGYILYRASRG